MKRANAAAGIRPLDTASAPQTPSTGATHWRARRNPGVARTDMRALDAAARTHTSAGTRVSGNVFDARDTSPSIALHIDTLVLDGVPVSQRARVLRAIQTELHTLCAGLSEQGPRVCVRETPSEASEFIASEQPDANGRAIARAIFRALRLDIPRNERGGS